MLKSPLLSRLSPSLSGLWSEYNIHEWNRTQNRIRSPSRGLSAYHTSVPNGAAQWPSFFFFRVRRGRTDMAGDRGVTKKTRLNRPDNRDEE